MSKTNHQILSMGLPETGKTSFLAALSYYVESTVPGKLFTQYKQSSNSSYITSIIHAWLKGEKPDRNKLGANSGSSVELYLEESTSKFQFVLHIPDHFGETFEHQFVNREMDEEYYNNLGNISAILLFIHPDQIKQPLLIENIADALNIAEQIDSSDNANIDQINTIEAVEFIEEECPTQLILIDLLQNHLDHFSTRPVLVSIIVSAWDLVQSSNQGISPLKWIEIELPMVYQFLQSNFEDIEFKLFGVSAQGGDVTKEQTRSQLMDLPEPADRFIIQEENSITKNITSPIAWIISKWYEETKTS